MTKLNKLSVLFIWRLYTSLSCPYAQRVWITRNYKVRLFLSCCNTSCQFGPPLPWLLLAWLVISIERQHFWNYLELQGLQGKIKLVPLNLWNRPAWYKEKVYSANKVNHILLVHFSAYVNLVIWWEVQSICYLEAFGEKSKANKVSSFHHESSFEQHIFCFWAGTSIGAQWQNNWGESGFDQIRG